MDRAMPPAHKNKQVRFMTSLRPEYPDIHLYILETTSAALTRNSNPESSSVFSELRNPLFHASSSNFLSKRAVTTCLSLGVSGGPRVGGSFHNDASDSRLND